MQHDAESDVLSGTQLPVFLLFGTLACRIETFTQSGAGDMSSCVHVEGGAVRDTGELFILLWLPVLVSEGVMM